ncbi:MAG: hypothetical protein KA193_03115 [Bacteroidia bacterium]|jgi:hypothetical protein|uniref:hypothetical protein n=1 Tax=Candidatus Pollutiaquabacter sp. TaxID=3416354 RepID=UPI001B5656A8|nr:hypothetical protein [Bacteroidia bacterium]
MKDGLIRPNLREYCHAGNPAYDRFNVFSGLESECKGFFDLSGYSLANSAFSRLRIEEYAAQEQFLV